ncbi:hypothetical protein BV898_19300 [Hypsibius exemplaris]|uniref:Uncharacterized protein n=1 Tax=Hypsibius exemplaris TaxID=2072580 RepID=A0A9X6NRY4_HYPEX|nr:hypothetical protein BV898_19300 [Hypsibius exemplaris]
MSDPHQAEGLPRTLSRDSLRHPQRYLTEGSLRKFNLMKTCWHLDPTARPTFVQAWKTSDAVLCENSEGTPYLQLDEPIIGDAFQELDAKILECLITGVDESANP